MASIIARLKKKRELNKAKEIDESRRHDPITGKRNPGNKTNLEMSDTQPKLKNRRHKKTIDEKVKQALRPVHHQKQIYNPKIQGGSYVDPPSSEILHITKAVEDYNKSNPQQDDNKFTKERKRKRTLNSIKNKLKRK